MYSNVIGKDVDHDRDEGEQEWDEWVNVDDEKEGREDAALWDSTTQAVRGG
jgi:hypothetical protein